MAQAFPWSPPFGSDSCPSLDRYKRPLAAANQELRTRKQAPYITSFRFGVEYLLKDVALVIVIHLSRILETKWNCKYHQT